MESKKVIQHDLKCWPESFHAIKRGDKTFEVRVNDRKYEVGNILNLQEFDPNESMGIGDYTGYECKVLVTYILDGSKFGSEFFGVKRDTVIMAIKKLNTEDHEQHKTTDCRVGGEDV